MNVIKNCRDKMSKQFHYDFGMRAIKNITKELCRIVKGKNVIDDENRLISETLGYIIYCKSNPEDREILLTEMKENFGMEAFLPDWTSENLGARVKNACFSRHGVGIIGCTDMAVSVKEINEAMGATGVELTCSEDGSWLGEEGDFTNCLKQDVDGPFNIYCSGNLNYANIENLNTVLDDNKVLVMPSGNRYHLKDNVRVIMFIKDCKEWSPANVSRLAIINKD